MKRLILLLLIVILVPQVAFAAWWNPLSWFKEEQNIDQEKAELLERLIELEEKVDSQEIATSTTQEPSETVIKEKIINQTITVDNPELQKKINALIAENITLQTKINSQSSLVQQLNSCKADLTEIRAQLNRVSSDVETTQSTSQQTTTSGITVTLGQQTCSTDNLLEVSIPITIIGGWWEYGEIELSKNLTSPSSYSSIDTLTKMSISPGIKVLKLAKRPGIYPITIRLSNAQALNGELDLRSQIYTFKKTLDIFDLPCY